MVLKIQNLPQDIQNHIADMLRPLNNPFAKAPDVAQMKISHRNFREIFLWQKIEFMQRISEWYNKNMTRWRGRWIYGTLSKSMIKKGWTKKKINIEYGHQRVNVDVSWAKCPGSSSFKWWNLIRLDINLEDLRNGFRPLPSCFGGGFDSYNILRNDAAFRFKSGLFVDTPTRNILLPKKIRREMLIDAFNECITIHYSEIMTKGGTPPDKLNFMNSFKQLTQLPSAYNLTLKKLFELFLERLGVVRKASRIYRNVRAQYIGEIIASTTDSQITSIIY